MIFQSYIALTALEQALDDGRVHGGLAALEVEASQERRGPELADVQKLQQLERVRAVHRPR